MMTQGNSCNIGVIARNPAFLPYLRDQLTEEVVAEQFKHCFEVLIVFPFIVIALFHSLAPFHSFLINSSKAPPVVHRYDLPGVNAMNFVLEASLGGIYFLFLTKM